MCGGCRGDGCDACLRTGYKGRVPVVEWLKVSEALRAQVRARDLSGVKPERSLEESAREVLQQGWSNEIEYRRMLGL